MTSSLVVFGDSLADSGNIAALARLVGGNPFADPIYGNGTKASDGLVLSEQIARRLGGRLEPTELLNLLSLPLKQLSGGINSRAQFWNYAYGGASSGRNGSRRAGLTSFPLGLRSQALAFAGSAPQRADLDALIIAGSNDIIDVVDRPARLLRVLRSAGTKDNRRLSNRLARRIAGNVTAAVDVLTGKGIDETVIVGLAPLSETPFVRQKSSSLSPVLRGRMRRFVDQTANGVNRRLRKRFNSPGVDDDVLVVDGGQAWNSVASPRFLDDVHPTARTSGRLADFVVARIAASADLSSYGFGG